MVKAAKARALTLLVEGRSGAVRGLSGVMAFGTSMLPLFRPGAELWAESVAASGVRAGDLIAFRGASGALVTHRVLKILPGDEGLVFLTKGDNRLSMDPPVGQGQLEGLIVRAGGRDIRTPGWLLLGRAIAFLSYAQARAYRRLSRGRLNRLRYRLQEAGLLPAVGLRGVFRALTDPLSGYRLAADAWESLGYRRARAVLSIGTWTPRDVPEATGLWNESFPTHPSDEARLRERLFRGPAFDPSGCFLARRAGGPLLGWVLANPEGIVEVLAVSEEGWRMRAGEVLLREAVRWLGRRGVTRLSLGPHWVLDSPLGPRWSGLFDCASPLGFEPVETWAELSLSIGDRRPPPRRKVPEGLEIRGWRESDEPAIEEFLLAHRYRHALSLYRAYAAAFPDRKGVLLAFLDGRLAGFCRWIEDARVRDYSDLTWAWSADRPAVPRGYFFHLIVDEKQRGRGIGTAMAKRSFEELWDAGCMEIRLCVIEEGRYEPFGFRRKARFLKFRLAGAPA